MTTLSPKTYIVTVDNHRYMVRAFTKAGGKRRVLKHLIKNTRTELATADELYNAGAAGIAIIGTTSEEPASE